MNLHIMYVTSHRHYFSNTGCVKLKIYYLIKFYSNKILYIPTSHTSWLTLYFVKTYNLKPYLCLKADYYWNSSTFLEELIIQFNINFFLSKISQLFFQFKIKPYWKKILRIFFLLFNSYSVSQKIKYSLYKVD